MARGLPKSTGSGTVALPNKRIPYAPLRRIGAFQSEQQDRETGRTYYQFKLSLDWGTGLPQRDAEGQLVLDEDGNEQEHLINDGFVTLSGHHKGNLVKILRALGFTDDRFYDKEGSLNKSTMESIEVEFGTNGLGDNYAGCDWGDLPEYVLPSRGGETPKRKVEVPILSFTIDGYELIGRVCELALSVKDEYNRIEAYLEHPDFVDLDTPIPQPGKAATPAPAAAKAKPAPKTSGRPAAKAAGKSREEVEVDNLFGVEDPQSAYTEATPFDPEPVEKRAVYVTRRMKEAGIPGVVRIPLLAFMLEDPNITSIANINQTDAITFKALVEAGDPTEVLRQAYVKMRDNTPADDSEPPWDEAATDDDDADFDDF